MKTNLTLIFSIILLPFFALCQDKNVNAIAFTQDSKLMISAKAETLTNVTFTISLTENADEKTMGFKFPITSAISPLNQKTFRDNMTRELKKVAQYQWDTELLEGKLDEILKTPKNDEENKTLKSKKDSLSRILFEVLKPEQKKEIFGLENISATKISEVLGMEGVNKDKLQQDMTEIASKRVKDVLDKATQKDFKQVLVQNEKEAEYFKAQKRLNDLFDRLYLFFEGQLDLLFQFDTEPVAGTLFFNKVINGVQYFTGDTDELYLKKRVRNYHELVRKLNKAQKNNGKNSFEEKIKEHFEENEEYKSKYIDEPLQFYKNFGKVIDKYDVYTENKRIKIIRDRLLELKNTEVYDSLYNQINRYDSIKNRIKKLEIQGQYLSHLVGLFEKIEYYKYRKEEIPRVFYEAFYKAESELEEIYFSYNETEKDEYVSMLKILRHLRGNNNYNQSDTTRVNNAIKNYEVARKELNDKRKELDEENSKIMAVELQPLITGVSEIISENSDALSGFIIGERDEIIKRIIYGGSLQRIENYSYEASISKHRNREKEIEKEMKGSLEDLQRTLSCIKQGLVRAPLWDIEATNIDMDFNDGFLERTVVYGKVKGITIVDDKGKIISERLEKIVRENPHWETNFNRTLKFTSQFPYGFSSRIDYEDMKTYKLVVSKGRDKEFLMEFEDIFPEYLQQLENNRLDFSPKNQSVKIELNSEHDDKDNKLLLKKEVSSKLFNIKVYTDFIGFGNDPNGVAQFEFDRIIPLRTKRYPVGPRRTLGRLLSRSFNWGYANYILPQFRWARLNTADNVENLSVSTQVIFEGGVETQESFVTLLDLFRFENISVGADLNLFSFDIPKNKLRTEMNIGARFGRTRVLGIETDSNPMMVEENENNGGASASFVNTWRYYPELLIRLRPDERYGANFGIRYMRYNTSTSDFSVVSSEERFRESLSDNPQWLLQFGINAHFSPSARNDNKFFFRYRYTNTQSFETNGFSELQLGYIISLRSQIRNQE